ncbi:MAG: SDR family oxidoreductase [Alphaproteobacteria bacterium]|nr:SDR family oxidoreductase [Alphaproteobacteria bacterium]
MQLFDLIGRTAFITGASNGLGEQFARCLSRAGACVILVARREDRLSALANELKNAFSIEMDMSDKVSIQRGFDMIEQQGERIDICVNNAGIFKETPIFDPDKHNDFECVMQTNLMGVRHVTKAAANHMKNHKIHGSIINIGSINGDGLLTAGATSYNVSKAAVLHITKSLVPELSPYHIRINSISPGYFPSGMTKIDDWLLNEIPLGFAPDASDLDGALLYLASNRASRYVTGTCLTVDGGISVGSLQPTKSRIV